MNTSKQVNIMIGTVLLAILMFGGYIGYESTRQVHAREENTERIAERGARLYVNNCRSCHGMEGEGHVAPALNRPGFRIIGLHDASGAEPTPQGEADALNAFLFNSIACGRTNTFMPLWAQRFGGSLSDTQVRQLTTLITEGRWDLVKAEGEHHDAETGDTKETILVQDASTLALTTGNCGQYSPEAAAQFRERDPFTAAPAAPADGAATPSGGAAAPAAGGKAAEGKAAATSAGCVACHAASATAGVGPGWKGIAGAQVNLADGSTATRDDAYLREAIVNPNAKIVRGFNQGIMPGTYGTSLKPEQIDAIIEYIKSLQ